MGSVMRLLSASSRIEKCVWRLLAASCWAAMLIIGAGVQTAPPAGAQAQSDPAIATWGVTGSAPQTGSSAYTSGKAFEAKEGEGGATAPASQAQPITRSRPPGEQAAEAAKPPAAKILVVIDKPTQEMKVLVDGVERYSWKVSTGIRRYDTPAGTYTARSMNEIWYSKQWDDAPMPHAIFFTKKGHAIHGTEETRRLGRPASHGCVRLAPENATILFGLVKEIGLNNTEIVLNGGLPKHEPKVAGNGKKTVKTALNKPGSKNRVARSAPRRQPATTKQQIAVEQPVQTRRFVNSRFDPYSIGTPRRLSRRERLQLYYGGAARALPPAGYYKAAPPPQAYRRYYDGR
jgi:lipoprotein-anchoring transpeptidase ErfK/SrfK